MQMHERRLKEKARKPSKAATDEEGIDDALEATFPASDPPSTSPMTTGAPKHERADDHSAKTKGHSSEG
jgi:hypothetical protein